MPSMSKAHYELIAETIQELEVRGIVRPKQRAAIAEAFADSLKRTNGMFLAGRFVRACVPGANVRARS